MANVRMQLPDGREIDIDEGLLKDPEVNQQFQDMYDQASGPIGVLENAGEKVKDYSRGILQNLSGGAKWVALKAKQLDQDLPESIQSYKGKDTKQLQSYKVGEWLENVIPKTDVRVRDTFASQVATGLGQVTGAIGLGLATGGSSTAGQLITSAVPAVAMQASEDYDRAKKKGATEEQAQTAGNWGGVWGVTDVLPFDNALKILKKAVPGWKGLSKEAVQQLILEGGQEGLQQVLSNATAQMTYDDKQALMEDVLPSATVGGVVGAISGTILHALGAKGKVKIGGGVKSEENPATAQEAIDRLRARGVGATAQETTVSAPAESVAGEPTTVDTIQANEEGILTPSQTFAKQMMDAGKSDSEIHTNLTLLNVIAQTRGMDLDTFVEKAIAGVQTGTGTTEGDVLNQAGGQPFFSKLESVVQEKMPNRMDGQALRNMLEKAGVPKDEFNLLDFGYDLYEDKFTPVSKQNILDQIKAASVQTEDVVLGQGEPHKRTFSVMKKLVAENDNLGYDFADEAAKDLLYGRLDPNQVEWNNENDKAWALKLIADKEKPTEFSSYQLPGAKEGSYREMFVTAPQKDVGQYVGSWSDGHSQYGKIDNPIVRIRYNEREVDGKRILFVEEMQGPSDSEQQKMPPYLRKRIYDIGTKRILALAKEQGFDGVAWTTGEQQAERYDLSKQIKELTYYKNANGTYDLGMHTTDGHIVTNAPTQLQPSQLESYVGKDLAKKILSDKHTQPKGRVGLREGGVFTEPDLKVGGEGLKDTYNKRIPSLMKKYGKGSVDKISIKDTVEKNKYNYYPPDEFKRNFNMDGTQFPENSHGVEILSPDGEEILEVKSFHSKAAADSFIARMQNVELEKSSALKEIQYTPITPQTPDTYSLFQSLRSKNEQSTSDVKGSVNFLEDGRAVITLMQGSDQSTMLHEIGHVLRRWLTPEEMVTANEFVGATSDKWTVEQEEKWARGWERYLRRGKAPNEYLAKVFEKMRTWLRRIYKTVKGSEIDVHLDPKTIALFDKILTPAELPSQKPAWAMPFEAWQKVYGEDEAAMYGLTGKSVSVRAVSRFNALVNSLTNTTVRGVFLGRYTTPAETQAQLAIVSDPTYLQTPLANNNIDEYLARVLNLFSVRAMSNFHLGESVQPLLDDLKAQMDSAERRGLFDNDPGHAYSDDYYAGFVTRRDSFKGTIDFVSKLAEVQRVRETWATPAREQMLAVRRDQYHDTQDVIMDRTTGRLYAIETKGVHSASMIDVDTGFVRRVPISDLYTQFLWPELISDDGRATLTKEEWMAERHYEMVLDALEKGEAVPSWNIAQHITKDPMLQEAYDRAKASEDATDGTAQQNDAIAQLFQEAQSERLEEEVVQPTRVGAAPAETLQDLEQIGKVVDESYRELVRLANVLDQQDGPRLIDLIKKVELQKLVRQVGAVGEMNAEQYIAELFKELDEYKAMLEKQSGQLDHGTVGALTDRIVTIYQGLKRFTQSIEDNGQARLMDEEPTVNQIRRLSHWAQRTLLHKEPNVEGSVGKFFEKAIFTMQGLSWRHPILKPLFKSWIHMNNSATKTAHDLFLGKPEIETLQFQNAKGVTEIKVRAPGLRNLKSLATNSPAYDAMRSLVLVGDRLHTQFTLDEVMLGLGTRVDALIAEAEKITNPEEKALAVQKATAFMALDEVLSRRSVEERKQAAVAYFEIQDSLQYMFFKTKKVLNDMLGRAGEDVIKQIAPHGYIPGYFPHMRFGKYGVLVKDSENKTKYFTSFEDWVSQKNALAELKAKYPNDTVVTVDTTNKLEYHMGGGQDLITALQDVIGRTKLNEVITDKDALETVQKMLLETTSEMVKAQGIFSMFKERTDIPGWDERISQVTHKRVTDFASAMAKIEFAQKGAQELSGIRSNPNLYNYAKEWFGAMLEGADVNDAHIAKVRAAIFLKHLGFNVKTAFIMFMDKLTNAPSVLGRHTKNVDTKIIKGLGESMKFMSWLHTVEREMNAQGISRDEAIKNLGLAEGFDAETTNALLWSKDSGATLAKFAPEVWAHEDMTWESGRSGQSGVGRALDITKFTLGKVFDYSSWMGSKMEEMNKLSTFLTAYKVFRHEKGWTYDRAIDVAQDVVNDAHVVYGRGNIPLPFLRKGIWKYTRMAYIFRAFEHNYAQLLFNMSTIEGTRGKLMAMRSLATLAALAGVPALPFLVPLFKMYGLSTGDDPEQWFHRTLTRVTGSAWAAKIFSDGLPAVAGITLRGSLQVGAYETWEEVLSGVAGSTVKDVMKAGGQGWDGDWDGFSKTLLPASLGNLYKAYQGSNTGVITAKGGPRREDVIGDAIKYKGFEKLLKAASFTIEREARSQRLDMAMRREDQYWQEKRDAIYTKFAKGARLEDKAYIQAALEEAVGYERERASRKAYDVTPISRSGLKKSLEESGLKKKNVLQVLRMTGKLP